MSSSNPPTGLAARIEAALAAQRGPLKIKGSELYFRCFNPEKHAHGDSHPSARWNKDKLTWHCDVCKMGGGWKDAATRLGTQLHQGHNDNGHTPGVTLEALAAARGLDPTFLRSLGLRNNVRYGRPAVSIPYRDASGHEIRTRWRLALDKAQDGHDNRFAWGEGDTILPYGLDRLPEARSKGYVVLVEGETDTACLWQHGVPALGIPGATTWKPEWTTYLQDVPTVYAWEEPDAAGAGCVASIAKDIPGLRVVQAPPEAKDPAELAKLLGPAFPTHFQTLLDQALPWQPPDAVDLGALLGELVAMVNRYVVLDTHVADAISLWAAHTHALDAAQTTPYMNVTSAEKRSGKTRLLEVLSALVARPWLTGRVSAAVLTRKMERDSPTLLLDETDAAFKGGEEYVEALRGILNSGHRRGGVCSLCIKAKGDFDLRDFAVFGPKAFAGLGHLPDTVRDRSITLTLKRKAPTETVQRFRLREAQVQAQPLRDRLQRWAQSAVPALSEARPNIPDELDDRAADGWEPLLAIADAAGGDWPERARAAALALSVGGNREDTSLGVRLLADVRRVFMSLSVDRLASTALVTGLNAIEESPWGDLRGKPLDTRRLAQMLKPFGVAPRTIRPTTGDGSTAKGYMAEDFTDAWTRYLTLIPVQPSQPSQTPDSDSGDVTDVTLVTAAQGYASDTLDV